ncbi:MAG: family 16 glycosylhydrolase, partial [Sediminibacterium sp.]|nr:family 16 glycosylhydrolase [Sediminibacterium sp.]
MNKLYIYLLTIIFFSSCDKSDGREMVALPSNLTVAAVVRAGNTGWVDVTFSATNAASFELDFGNGDFKSSTENQYSYQYTTAGNYIINVIAKNPSGTISKSLPVTIVLTSAAIWSDEFNYTGSPDPTKWVYDLGNNNGWGNSESQYYTNRPENVTVSNGTLKITAIKEAFSGFNYTSARILTQGKFDVKYVRIEARIKLPEIGGGWPAFWMLGSNFPQVGWPACGEIDIMEMVGNQLNKIFAALHFPGHSGGQGTVGTTINPTATTNFHVYSVTWNASTITWYIDGVQFAQYANSASIPY